LKPINGSNDFNPNPMGSKIAELCEIGSAVEGAQPRAISKARD
jgi:hypothetical protein